MADHDQPITVTFGKLLASEDVNPTLRGLNGEAITDFLIKGVTYLDTTGEIKIRRKSATTLTQWLFTEGETTDGAITMVEGTPSVTAAVNVPQINTTRYVRPNQTDTAHNVTGANWIFKAIRKGTGSTISDGPAGDGNLSALYSFMVVTIDDSDFTGFNTGHDTIGFASLVKSLDGTDLGYAGTVASTGRVWAGYLEAIAISPASQAIALEAIVYNSTGVDAVAFASGAYAKKNVGVQIVSFVETNGTTGRWNSVGLRFASNGSVANTADNGFMRGIYFEAFSVAIPGYAIDIAALTTQTPIRLQNGGIVVARDAANSADVGLFKLNSSNQVEVYTNSSNYKIMTASGGTDLIYITSAGRIDLRQSTNWTGVAGGATTPTLTAIATATSGMPSQAANTQWVKLALNGTNGVIPWWPMTA